MTTVLARNWWALAVRGVLAVLFGLIAFIMPGVTLTVIVWWIGGYSIVFGIIMIALAFALLLGALAAAYATLRIVRLSPAEAIRRGT